MKIAIIDLGTNTFNLLIADVKSKTSWNIIYKIKEAVKLGQGGINKGFIAPEAFERGIKAMECHSERLRNYNVDKAFAFGTSALRDAANGQDFISEVKKRFNIDITLISGEKEAELIYFGVKQTIPQITDTFLILDIGGGSNEFIIANQQQIFWKKSFNLGMARLMEKFNPSDPITSELKSQLEIYFDQELQSLFKAMDEYKPSIMVGASGSFDSLINMLYADTYPTDDFLPTSQELKMELFEQLYEKLIHSTRSERDRMPGLEPVRRDMIVLAVIFVKFVLKRLQIKQLYQSSYALKEGAAWEMINNN